MACPNKQIDVLFTVMEMMNKKISLTVWKQFIIKQLIVEFVNLNQNSNMHSWKINSTTTKNYAS